MPADQKDQNGVTSSTTDATTAAMATPKPVVAIGTSEPEITLIQFGIEFSKKEKRVELLNAFIFTQRQAGLHKDVKSAYIGRFEAFVHQPVDKV